MHDGRIWMDSEPGKGTTISFSLPIERPAPIPSSARRWITPYSQPEGRSRAYKAPDIVIKPRYVIYDHSDVLERIFNRYMDEVEVVSVSTPEEAVKQLAVSPSQALIANIPIEQSLQAGWLNHLPLETPSITFWIPGISEAVDELGVIQYLLKPVTADMLHESIKSLGKPVKTVLVVDDEPDLVRLYMRILSDIRPKFRLMRASTGQQALDLMREYHPDVVFLDLTLPEKDGYQVLQEKKVDPEICDIKVIIVSARDPSNEAIVTHRLMVSRSNGFSAQNLLDFSKIISQFLSPGWKPTGQDMPAIVPE
jgi:CheY-like chemotaxis protein